MYPTNYPEIAQARRDDLIKEAEKERLIQFIQAGQPSLKGRILIKTAMLLAKLSEQLQEQYLRQKSVKEGLTQS